MTKATKMMGLGGCIRFDEFFDEFSRNLDLDIWILPLGNEKMNFRKSQVETWQRYGICALKEDGQWDLWDVDLLNHWTSGWAG